MTPETPVDFAYLEDFAAGDLLVVDEVLALFREQAELWTPLLDPSNAGWRDAVHTLKGSAGGVGAFVLRTACERAEAAEIGAAGPALERVKDALGAAIMAVATYQHGRLLASLRR